MAFRRRIKRRSVRGRRSFKKSRRRSSSRRGVTPIKIGYRL